MHHTCGSLTKVTKIKTSIYQNPNISNHSLSTVMIAETQKREGKKHKGSLKHKHEASKYKEQFLKKKAVCKKLISLHR